MGTTFSVSSPPSFWFAKFLWLPPWEVWISTATRIYGMPSLRCPNLLQLCYSLHRTLFLHIPDCLSNCTCTLTTDLGLSRLYALYRAVILEQLIPPSCIIINFYHVTNPIQLLITLIYLIFNLQLRIELDLHVLRLQLFFGRNRWACRCRCSHGFSFSWLNGYSYPGETRYNMRCTKVRAGAVMWYNER